MDGLFGFAKQFVAHILGPREDDCIDRMNYLWTSSLMIILSLFVTSTQLMRNSINCWIPGHLAGFSGYINDVCWISNTYWIPFTADVPGYPGQSVKVDERQDMELNYYQWIPLMLLLQGLLFYVPRFIWRIGKGMSGIDLRKLIVLACEASMKEDRAKTVKLVTSKLDQNLDRAAQRRHGTAKTILMKACCHCCDSTRGRFLFPYYIFVKFLFLINAIGQFILINRFLAVNHWLYGFELLDLLTKDANGWRFSGLFPRVTLCDFLVRVLGNLHRYTVQCVLPVNMLTEKVYIVIYFWLIILMVINTLNIIAWLHRMGNTTVRHRSIENDLLVLRVYNKERDKDVLNTFLNNYLRVDGSLLMKLVRENAGELTALEILEGLWEKHRKRSHAAEALLKDHDNNRSKKRQDSTLFDS